MANSKPLVMALVTFFKGNELVVKGQLVRAGHDVHKGAEALFEKLGANFDYDEAEYAARDKALAESKAKELAAKAAADAKALEAKVESDVKAIEAPKPEPGKAGS